MELRSTLANFPKKFAGSRWYNCCTSMGEGEDKEMSTPQIQKILQAALLPLLSIVLLSGIADGQQPAERDGLVAWRRRNRGP